MPETTGAHWSGPAAATRHNRRPVPVHQARQHAANYCSTRHDNTPPAIRCQPLQHNRREPLQQPRPTAARCRSTTAAPGTTTRTARIERRKRRHQGEPVPTAAAQPSNQGQPARITAAPGANRCQWPNDANGRGPLAAGQPVPTPGRANHPGRELYSTKG